LFAIETGIRTNVIAERIPRALIKYGCSETITMQIRELSFVVFKSRKGTTGAGKERHF
jgi:hypothetical protein